MAKSAPLVTPPVNDVAKTVAPKDEPPAREEVSAVRPPSAVKHDTAPVAREIDPNDPLSRIPSTLDHDWRDPGGRLHPAERQAEQRVQNASSLARRGATHSARRELESAFVILSQALDMHYSTNAFTECLHRGLLAMEEANDFAVDQARGQLSMNVELIVSRHRSEALGKTPADGCTPRDASQKYYSFAKEHLVASCGGSRVAAHALFGLGKLHAKMAQAGSIADRRHEQRAMMLQEAVLMIDGSHDSAATELGALLIASGRLKDARDVLTRGLSRDSSRDRWRQLATVHARLGEVGLAEQARVEETRVAQLVNQQRPQAMQTPHGTTVKWVDRETFNRAAGDAGPRRSGDAPTIPVQTAAQPQWRRTSW
jgi:hypothetical protein